MELPDRDRIEASAAARFARLNSRLRHKLEDYLGSPPDVARVPESFWQEVRDEMNRETAIVLLLIWGASAQQHGLGVDLAASQSLAYASSRAAEVADAYAATTRTMLADAGHRWRQGPLDSATLQRDLVAILGPARAERTATNETTRAQTDGGESGTRQTIGLSDLDTWYTRRDDRVCPVCEPLHGSLRSDWQAAFPLGPPAHPGCRCWIRYSRGRGEVRA